MFVVGWALRDFAFRCSLPGLVCVSAFLLGFDGYLFYHMLCYVLVYVVSGLLISGFWFRGYWISEFAGFWF